MLAGCCIVWILRAEDVVDVGRLRVDFGEVEELDWLKRSYPKRCCQTSIYVVTGVRMMPWAAIACLRLWYRYACVGLG